MALCECGCGQEVREGNKYILGHGRCGKPCSEEHKRKIGQANKGRISEITLQKAHEANRGRKLTEEHRRKISESVRGEKHPMYSKLYSDEMRKKLSEAHKGIQAGEKHPMYGKHHSEYAKIKISEKKKGQKHTEQTKMKISNSEKGRPSPFKGKHQSDAWKKIMSEVNKGNQYTKGKNLGDNNVMRRPEIRSKFIGENNPAKRPEIRAKLSGENHHNWQGGISFEPYCPKFNKILKDAVRNRDNRTCQLCNSKENGQRLSVHHIHYDKENCYPDLIGLCRNCNAKVNFNHEYYEQLFMNKLNEKGLLVWTKNQDKVER